MNNRVTCLCSYLFNDTSIPRLLLARIYRSNVQHRNRNQRGRLRSWNDEGAELKWRVKLHCIIFSPFFLPTKEREDDDDKSLLPIKWRDNPLGSEKWVEWNGRKDNWKIYSQIRKSSLSLDRKRKRYLSLRDAYSISLSSKCRESFIHDTNSDGEETRSNLESSALPRDLRKNETV